ncbi:MAG TPA: VWA domain-containing protein [Blastocatellia bacterium]|nr:VWA domain-containing protein [Blastocatellia bacterium]
MKHRHSRSLRMILSSCCVLALLATTPHAQSREKKDDQIIACSLGGEMVLLPVTVTGGDGLPVTDLIHTDFVVFDKGQLQEITFFNREDAPLSVGILIDMPALALDKDKKRLAAISAGIADLVKQGNPANEYFLLGFDSAPRLMTGWATGSEPLLDALNKVAGRKPAAATALFDACDAALEKMAGRNSRGAFLLFSDGQDNQSQSDYGAFRERVERSSARIYAIRLARAADHAAPSGASILGDLARITGGESYSLSEPATISGTLQRIAYELRHQYLIGYYPSAFQRNGEWHAVKIKVIPPPSPMNAGGKPSRLAARTRKGWYAAPSSR